MYEVGPADLVPDLGVVRLSARAHPRRSCSSPMIESRTSRAGPPAPRARAVRRAGGPLGGGADPSTRAARPSPARIADRPTRNAVASSGTFTMARQQRLVTVGIALRRLESGTAGRGTSAGRRPHRRRRWRPRHHDERSRNLTSALRRRSSTAESGPGPAGARVAFSGPGDRGRRDGARRTISVETAAYFVACEGLTSHRARLERRSRRSAPCAITDRCSCRWPTTAWAARPWARFRTGRTGRPGRRSRGGVCGSIPILRHTADRGAPCASMLVEDKRSCGRG